MSFLGSMFDSSKGAGFEGQRANVLEPSLQDQQAFLAALQGQNGIQNQSNVFNQLQGVANGTGPNPAQAMLNQATGQNVQNQASLMAGQRGASSNPGLIARQAGHIGGNLQQQALGQGAVLQAQQSLGALGQMGGLANQQVGQLGGYLQGLNQINANQQGNINNANAQIAQGNQKFQANVFGGLIGDTGTEAFKAFSKKASPAAGAGAGTPNAAGGLSFSEGGEVGPSSLAGKFLKQAFHDGGIAKDMKIGGHVPGKAQVKGDSLRNDTVDAKLSPGEIVIPRTVVNSENPEKKSAQFVNAILRKQGKRS